MTIPMISRRGCTRTRGQTDIPHLHSLGGNMARRANQLYMLTVRRESLVNKKNSLEQRLEDIRVQIKEIDSQMKSIPKAERKKNATKMPKKNKGSVLIEY